MSTHRSSGYYVHAATLSALASSTVTAEILADIDHFVAAYSWCPDDAFVQACAAEAAWIRENLDAAGRNRHQHEALGLAEPWTPIGGGK